MIPRKFQDFSTKKLCLSAKLDQKAVLVGRDTWILPEENDLFLAWEEAEGDEWGASTCKAQEQE